LSLSLKVQASAHGVLVDDIAGRKLVNVEIGIAGSTRRIKASGAWNASMNLRHRGNRLAFRQMRWALALD